MKKYFTLSTKEGSARLLALFLALILVCSFAARMVSTDGGTVKISRVVFDSRGATIDAQLYYPAGTSDADSLPAVLVAHGAGVGEGNLRGISEELARRGFVVLNSNAYNMGLSEQPINDEFDFGVDQFNRGGTPLMEIVGEPDLADADEAIAYLTALKEILVYAGVSDCNLEEGNMRSDVNISIRPVGETKLGTKVEIKNMNSFSGIHAALEYEARRQRACVAQGVPIVQETRRWDPEALETASMRSKENAHDYRYFPEPDLVPVALSEEQIEEWRKLLPEKPEVRRARMIEEYGIAEYDAGVLSQAKANADFFEATAKGLDKKTAKLLCNLYMGDVMALLNASGKTIGECALTPESLRALIVLSAKGTINGPTLKELLPELFEKGGDPEAIVKERGLGAVSDTAALEAFVDQAIAANPGPVADFKAGKKAAAGFFVGQVMKLSKGKADPKLVGPLVARKLAAL